MQNSAPKIKSYRDYIRFKIMILLLFVLLTAAAALVAVIAGSAGLTPTDVFRTLAGKGTKVNQTVIFGLRLPRTVTAIVAGIGLAVTGCAMQSILRNPLASASTIGVSQGAAFGAAFAIVVLGAGVQFHTAEGVTVTNPYLVSACAFAFSLLSTFVVLGLSRFKEISPETMILSGVALSALFSGGTAIIQYFADDVSLSAVVFWTFGDMGRTSVKQIWIMAGVTALSFIYFLLNRWNYNALESGESSAKGLGVNVNAMRLTGMVICSFTAAIIVSFVGIVNFVGLISPHVMRRIIGGDYRFLLPASALMGALMLLFSDIVARLVVSPVVLPIGAITSFLGAPLFLYLIFKGVGRR
ncbi:MAG: iron ABC transporter permease [Oscillospiraceae bacterium]|jgi:iron complex transport system permease protein|nr:iron ABC transporter permease [Oscillospiraceae bacterium]